MRIKTLSGEYGIYKFTGLDAAADFLRQLPAPADDLVVVSASGAETSVICLQEAATGISIVARQEHWRGMYFSGQLDFDLVGILSGLTATFAAADIGVLAVSTFDTDYVFVPCDKWPIAQEAAIRAGYTFEPA